MCVSYCHFRQLLYINHENCWPQDCQYASKRPSPCGTCKHKQGGVCSLTNAPLPEKGGCCHWNVTLSTSPQPITLAMLTMIGVGCNETIADVLDSLDTPYTLDTSGQVWLNPDDLALPEVYGLGTEHF